MLLTIREGLIKAMKDASINAMVDLVDGTNYKGWPHKFKQTKNLPVSEPFGQSLT